MAQVPYNPVPTTQPAGPAGQYENIQPNPSEFGGLIGSAEQKLGTTGEQAAGAANQIAVQFQERYNQIATQAGYNNLEKGYFNLVHGDPNADPKDPASQGILTLQGADAMNAYRPTTEKMDALRQQILNSMPNDASKLAFEESSRRLQYYTLNQVGNHVDQQTKVWGVHTSQAQVAQSQQNLAVNLGDPNAMNSAIHSARDGMISIAQNSSGGGTITPDNPQYTEMVRKADTQSAATTVATLAAQGKYAEARDFVQNFKFPPRGPNDPPEGIPITSAIDPLSREALMAKVQKLADVHDGSVGGRAAWQSTVPDRGGPPNDAVIQRIVTTAPQQQILPGVNLSPQTALAFAKIESDYGRNPRTNVGPHSGIFQQGDEEWAEVGGTPENRGDPLAQAELGTKFVARDMRIASQTLNRTAEGWEGYIIHQQGAKGGAALLTAPPTALAADVIAQSAGISHDAAVQRLTQNGMTPFTSVGQLKQQWQATFANAMASAAKYTSGLVTTNDLPEMNPVQARANYNAVMNDPNKSDDFKNAFRQNFQENERADEEFDRMATNKIMTDFTSDMVNNPAGVDINKYLNMPATWQTKQHIQQVWNEHLNGDGPMFSQLLDRALLPDSDPNKLTDLNELLGYAAQKQLGVGGLSKLQNIVEQARTPQGKADEEKFRTFLDGTRHMIVPSEAEGNIHAPIQFQRFTNFKTAALDMKVYYQAHGMPVNEIVADNGPIMRTIQQYLPTPGDLMRSVTESPTPTAPASMLRTTPVAPPAPVWKSGSFYAPRPGTDGSNISDLIEVPYGTPNSLMLRDRNVLLRDPHNPSAWAKP